jgi:hypothetical protein
MPGPDAVAKFATAPQQERETLDKLAARVCAAHSAVLTASAYVDAAHKAAQRSAANALAAALDAGDALLELQQALQERGIGWEAWLRKWGRLPLSTARFYAQLARHRAEIEAEIERVGELSLRAARRLIAEPTKKESKPKPDLMVAWSRATAEELTRHLDAVTVVGFLRVISLAFRRELESRLRKEKTEDASEPHYKLTMALRTALGCVKIADDPQTSRAVALSQEKVALNALRGLARMHADFHGLSVGFREAKDPKRDPKGDQKRRRAA